VVYTAYFDRRIWFVHCQNVFVRIKTAFNQITRHQESRPQWFIMNFYIWVLYQPNISIQTHHLVFTHTKLILECKMPRFPTIHTNQNCRKWVKAFWILLIQIKRIDNQENFWGFTPCPCGPCVELKHGVSDWAWCQKAQSCWWYMFHREVKSWDSTPFLEFDNFKPRLKSGICTCKCILWLIGSFFGVMMRVF
jgi:hypothetical protein